jgi:hypothetical protein
MTRVGSQSDKKNIYSTNSKHGQEVSKEQKKHQQQETVIFLMDKGINRDLTPEK